MPVVLGRQHSLLVPPLQSIFTVLLLAVPAFAADPLSGTWIYDAAQSEHETGHRLLIKAASAQKPIAHQAGIKSGEHPASCVPMRDLENMPPPSPVPTAKVSRASLPNPRQMPMAGKLVAAIQRAAARLPAEVGRQLLGLVEPKSLAIMASVIILWAGSQFIAVGEIADVILIVAARVALGSVAISAGRELFSFATIIASAQSDDDLDGAAEHLARAVSLLGVQTTLALLLRKPGGVLRDQYFRVPGGSADPVPLSAFDNPPSNRW
jgi:hypothetical protein